MGVPTHRIPARGRELHYATEQPRPFIRQEPAKVARLKACNTRTSPQISPAMPTVQIQAMVINDWVETDLVHCDTASDVDGTTSMRG